MRSTTCGQRTALLPVVSVLMQAGEEVDQTETVRAKRAGFAAVMLENIRTTY